MTSAIILAISVRHVLNDLALRHINGTVLPNVTAVTAVIDKVAIIYIQAYAI